MVKEKRKNTLFPAFTEWKKCERKQLRKRRNREKSIIPTHEVSFQSWVSNSPNDSNSFSRRGCVTNSINILLETESILEDKLIPVRVRNSFDSSTNSSTPQRWNFWVLVIRCLRREGVCTVLCLNLFVKFHWVVVRGNGIVGFQVLEWWKRCLRLRFNNTFRIE